jgi:hypothetical protein
MAFNRQSYGIGCLIALAPFSAAFRRIEGVKQSLAYFSRPKNSLG